MHSEVLKKDKGMQSGPLSYQRQDLGIFLYQEPMLLYLTISSKCKEGQALVIILEELEAIAARGGSGTHLRPCSWLAVYLD